VLTAMFSSGLAYLLSALTVTYRDFRFLIPFMVQIWLWVSFIMFPVPASMLSSPKWQVLLTLNPMYGMVAAYRKVLLPNYQFGPTPLQLGISIGATLVVFSLGIFYFRRTERRFADIA
jgi:lipopolysaccharide transport system permease protein